MELSNLHAPARTEQGLANAAEIAGCDKAALLAVVAVEAGGKGFDRHGRLVCLFEPHIFYRLLARRKPDLLQAAVDRGLAYPTWGEQPYPADSYPRLSAAAEIHQELAFESASWGLPQILGENFARANYRSAVEMVESFLKSEDEQLLALAEFIRNSNLSDALAKHDWAAFARGYNGPGFAKNAYDRRLAEAYERAKAMPPSKSVPAIAKATVSTGSSIAAGAAVWTWLSGGNPIHAVAAVAAAIAVFAALAFLVHRLPNAAPALGAAPPLPSSPPEPPIVQEPESPDLMKQLELLRRAKAEADQALAAHEQRIQETIRSLETALHPQS